MPCHVAGGEQHLWGLFPGFPILLVGLFQCFQVWSPSFPYSTITGVEERHTSEPGFQPLMEGRAFKHMLNQAAVVVFPQDSVFWAGTIEE